MSFIDFTWRIIFFIIKEKRLTGINLKTFFSKSHRIREKGFYDEFIKTDVSIQNQPLPYAYDALEPYIDQKTMHLHHDRHLQTYIDNLNKTIAGYPQFHSWTIEDFLRNISFLPISIQVPVWRNAGGVYNHGVVLSGAGSGRYGNRFVRKSGGNC